MGPDLVGPSFAADVALSFARIDPVGETAASAHLGRRPQTKEQLEPLIDALELGFRDVAEDAPDTPLVDGSKVVDWRVRGFYEAASTRRKRRVKRAV